MFHHDASQSVAPTRSPTWMLAYATVDVPLEPALRALATRHPGVPIFGCTSFRGVFSPQGFSRGLHLLCGETKDGVTARAVLREVGAVGARNAARAAALELRNAMGGAVDHMLLHATPGFEELLLEGIDDAFEGEAPAVYGGSAADDAIEGKWRVFLGTRVVREGFVLVGFSSRAGIFGSFVSGYTPTTTRGTVTSVRGRVVRTIDGRPAAAVYDAWTRGAITPQLEGGVVLAPTTLHPLGRVVDKVGAVTRYLLSHPHEVLPDGSLSLFTDVKVGDELILMVGSESALVDRTQQAVGRAIGREGERTLSGAVLIYCGGCVGALGERTGQIASGFDGVVSHAPFVGASTFGEVGCFTSAGKRVNRHGNLMCDAMVFGA